MTLHRTASLGIMAIFLACSLSAPAATEYRLDFGPPDSPVAKGFAPLDASAAYNAGRGFGWTDGAPENFATPRIEPRPTYWWHSEPAKFFDEMIDDLRVDGVESGKPLSLKLDLPKGRYRVVLTVGHMTEPRYGIDVLANGKPVQTGINARMWLFRGLLHKATGYYKRVRFSVDVGDDGLLLSFRGDDREFHRLLEIEKAKGPDERPQSRLQNRPLGPENAPFQDIGGPFSKISLMSLEVFPDAEAPIGMEPGAPKLSASASGAKDAALLAAITDFNAGKFEDAGKKFAALEDPLARGMGLMALAGHPQYENELEDATAAVAALKVAAGKTVTASTAREQMENAEIFLHGLTLFKNRGLPPANGEVWTWRAAAEFDQFQPGDLLYYKAQVQQGRFLIMLDAHQWCWSSVEGKKKLAKVGEVFPENRYFQFYVHGKLAASPDWKTEDYLARVPHAPRWAAGMYAGYNLLVDLAEWWSENKQAPNGSIGGGWSDDVELVGFFGFIAHASEGSSPLIMRLVLNLMNGVYASGNIDEVGGYVYEVGDTEHTAEWTGKTLPMMLAVRYGDPLWVERALQTARMMKDMWMGSNKHGHLLWRSNFLGGSGVGVGGSQLDSAINWRAAEPAAAVLHFTANPKIRELILKHADALHAAAMSTAKGKPKGVIPGDIDYESGEIGGRNVPTWYDPGAVPAAGNYGFHQYHGYRWMVLELAYELTGDDKYIEPIRLEAEYATKHGNGFKEPLHKLEKGSPAWVATVLKGAGERIEQIEYEKKRARGEDVRRADSAAIAGDTVPFIPKIRDNMPFVTTEAIATDRVGVPNSLKILGHVMGWKPGDPVPHLTYRRVGRDFAAAVLGADASSLTALVYLFDFGGKSKRPIDLVPWKLDLGAGYVVTWGADSDGDDKMDSQEGSREFILEQMGQAIPFELKTNTTYVIQMKQAKPSPLEPLLADLAIGAADVEYHAGWEKLFVTVHNIGAAAAGEFEVLVKEAGSTETLRAVGSSLDAPLDFTPKRMRFGFDFKPEKPVHGFSVSVKTVGNQPELTYRNNELETTIAFQAKPDESTSQSKAKSP